MKTLNIFYQEPDLDRWFKYDRYPRKLVRRLVRGKQRPGGVMMVALELMKGLDKIKVPYRFNDFNYARKHPNELVCIIGKPQVLFDKKWNNPILFGAGIFSHPLDCPDLLNLYPQLKKVLVPGEWMKKMFEPYYGNSVMSWPVGIDTEKWRPSIKKVLDVDFLIYDKVMWDYHIVRKDFIQPIISELENNNYTFEMIRYGNYKHAELIGKLSSAKAVIFLCEHETQGLAYQQILSTDTPILAWDRQGKWLDPSYYPHSVQYGPVTSVPYWDSRCGVKFANLSEFPNALIEFQLKLNTKQFAPRSFILENLSLEKCALDYYNIALPYL